MLTKFSFALIEEKNKTAGYLSETHKNTQIFN
jgi:hypothetical protein